MPVIFLFHKPDPEVKEIAERLAFFLHDNLAQNLSISQKEGDEGFLKGDDIIIHCFSNKDLKNKDIAIVVPVHDYPERRADIEKRKGAIIGSIQHFLSGYKRRKITGFVWIWLLPTAYGEF